MLGSKVVLNIIIILVFVGLVGVILFSEYCIECLIEVEVVFGDIYFMFVDL